jgi:predicted enzyme related to lactoylglutathione lyase
MATGVQTQIGRFVWHECNTTDIEKSKSFYTDLFGWELEVFKPGEIDYPMISVGGATHGGFGALEPGSGTPAHWLGVVWVESVDATVEKAKASGGNVLREAMDMPEVGRFAVIADPAGAAVSIYQPEGEGPVSEGVFVWDELVTSDVEAAKAFYTKVLGWTTADMDMGEAGVYTLLRSGEADRAGILKKPAGMESAPDAWLTYVGVDDVDGTAKRAAELGGQVFQPPFDVEGVGRLAVLADPVGAVFGIFKPTAR